jgi:hypothetical protein
VVVIQHAMIDTTGSKRVTRNVTADARHLGRDRRPNGRALRKPRARTDGQALRMPRGCNTGAQVGCGKDTNTHRRFRQRRDHFTTAAQSKSVKEGPVSIRNMRLRSLRPPATSAKKHGRLCKRYMTYRRKTLGSPPRLR